MLLCVSALIEILFHLTTMDFDCHNKFVAFLHTEANECLHRSRKMTLTMQANGH